jgi:hypothetical protein
MFSETYTANLRGSITTFALAAGLILILTALFAWRLRRSRRGLPRSSAFALALLAASGVGLAYWWLFFDTYYRMRANASEIVLQLELPAREVRIARADIGRFAIEPAPKGTARLVIETTSGDRYYSPPGPRANRVEVIERLEAFRMADLSQIAERYVRLVLQTGQHDADFVDAYYGPAALKPAEATKTSLAELLAAAASLQAETAAVALPLDADELTRLRHQYLMGQLRAVHTKLRMINGERFAFDEESRLLYDATAPTNPEAAFAETLRELDALIPGPGDLIDRYDAFRSRFVIPRDRLDRVFTLAIDECRRRTAQEITLPEGESFTVEYVTGKSWSAYNWYKGGFRSVIQVNTDLPITIDRAVDLACHEGYPGHHVYNALLEKSLVRDRRWMEFSVYPLFSPQSLIAEGTANYGIPVAFPGDSRIAYEKESLFPAAGLDASSAEQYYAVQALVDRLAYAGNEAARRYLNGEISREQAADWLQRYAMMPKDRAEQRTRFFDQYRSYVINYNLGKDLVKAWVEKQGTTPAERWKAFESLLSSPRLPSGLR